MEKAETIHGDWIVAYFDRDTPFIGITDKDEKVPMIIRADTTVKIMIKEYQIAEWICFLGNN